MFSNIVLLLVGLNIGSLLIVNSWSNGISGIFYSDVFFEFETKNGFWYGIEICAIFMAMFYLLTLIFSLISLVLKKKTHFVEYFIYGGSLSIMLLVGISLLWILYPFYGLSYFDRNLPLMMAGIISAFLCIWWIFVWVLSIFWIPGLSRTKLEET